MGTLDLGKKSIDFTAVKTNLSLFEKFITLVLLMQKGKGLFLEQNVFEEKKWCCDCLYLLNSIEALALPLLLTLISRKWDPWSMRFFPPEAAVYLYQATIWPWTEYCCQIRAVAHCICSETLDERQKRVCRTAGLLLSGPLELSAHHQNVTSWTLFYSYYFGQCSFKLVELIPNPHSSGRYTHYSNILHKSSHLS